MVQDFAGGFFTTLTHLPRWSDYLGSHDQTPGYQFLRMMLRVLQHQRGGNKRWVLKSPQHLEQFPALLKVFPDATFIITHRDPVDVSVSMATMMTYVMRMTVDKVDVPTVANYWITRIDELLSGCMRDHDSLPPDRTIDIRFDKFMADDLAMVERVWETADYRPTPESRAAVVDYLAGHTRGRLGQIDYRPGDLGLDRDELCERFAPYVERFVRQDEAMTHLQVRRPRFDFTEDVPFVWNPENPAFSFAMNATSIIAICFEQMIVAAVQEAKPLITDPEVAAEAMAFLRQEAQHSSSHRKHVIALIKRYPGLSTPSTRRVASFDGSLPQRRSNTGWPTSPTWRRRSRRVSS